MRHVSWKRILSLAAAGLLFYLGYKFHSPFFFKVRLGMPFVAFPFGLGLALWQGWPKRVTRESNRWFDRLLVLALLMGACLPFVQQRRGLNRKEEVLNSDPVLLRKLGRHFIVGYTDFSDLRNLVSHGAIGGIFITTRNIEGVSAEELRDEIDSLQKIQASLGLPPLWVATDQEGGLVSKLSPLARTLPALASVVDEAKADPQSLSDLVHDFARVQAEDLSALGINLNFSPVVDLKPATHSLLEDRHTRIDLRAISADPEVVSAVALEYCKTLKAGGVMPTLKHFPGLASVAGDTHLNLGLASRRLGELRLNDWKPFQETLSNADAFLMLGHVRVPELDPEHPVSLSRKVVQKLLRREWGFQGVLVTDDFSMGPIAEGPGGVGRAAVTALNAGVDLLLVSYDGELYYPAMLALLKAEAKGELAEGFLEESQARLIAYREWLGVEAHQDSRSGKK